MSDLKTQPTGASVAEFLKSIDDVQQRKECRELQAMMKNITGKRPRMWGESIVGFGDYRYKYATGREGDWFLVGFSPRKQNISIYAMAGVDRYPALLKKLGKHKIGKSCLYVQRVDDIDRDVLCELLARSVEDLQKRGGNACC